MTNDELIAALKADYSRIKRKRDAAEQMLDALQFVYGDSSFPALGNVTRDAVCNAVRAAGGGDGQVIVAPHRDATNNHGA